MATFKVTTTQIDEVEISAANIRDWISRDSNKVYKSVSIQVIDTSTGMFVTYNGPIRATLRE